MWLKIATTNRDPGVILSYSLQCVGDTKGLFFLQLVTGMINLCPYSLPKNYSY